ncbi:DUF4870 family protein [Peteryoungia aggregata]|uniref:DUF4870 family protein n=1 Tax=Peteryoungia aggregata TaxID=34013 RepID=UPI0035208066
MTDPQYQPPVTSGGEGWFSPGRLNVQVVYCLYLVSFVVGLTGIVGLIMAYVNRGKGEPWVDTHYTYAIRTFWIGLLYALMRKHPDGRLYRRDPDLRRRHLDRCPLRYRSAEGLCRRADRPSHQLVDLKSNERGGLAGRSSGGNACRPISPPSSSPIPMSRKPKASYANACIAASAQPPVPPM